VTARVLNFIIYYILIQILQGVFLPVQKYRIVHISLFSGES